jgi:hypothetical protein
VQALLYANLSSQTISGTPAGSSFTWPQLVEGSDLVLSFRFLKGLGSAAQEVQRNVVSFQAVIGRLDARPTSGTIKLKLGTGSPVNGVNVTTALNVATINAEVLQNAINALSGLSAFHPCVVTEHDDSYFVTGADGSAISFTLAENSTFPLAFLRVATELIDGAHVYALRLVQASAAFTDQQARVTVPAPVVSEIVSGSSTDGSQRNAVQKITFSPGFRGIYTVGYAGNQTTTLRMGTGSATDPSDGPTELAAALNALAPANGVFVVTNPDTGAAQIEFTGSLGAQSQDLLTVTVYGAPPGDVTCTLSLDTFPLWQMLNAQPKNQITLPFEVVCVLENEQDSSIHEEHTLIRTQVTIARRLGSDTLGTAPEIDWANPPLPASYVPFNSSQTGIGSFSYEHLLGDGSAHVFTLTHGQGSDHISNVNVLHNTTPGAALVPGTDFTWRRINSNVIEITITGSAPASDSLKAIITFAQTRTQFIEGVTFEIGQINGLTAALASITGRLTTVENNVGITGGGTTTPAADRQPTMQEPLPKRAVLLPWRSSAPQISFSDLASVDMGNRRSLKLLPALNTASFTSLPGGSPDPDPSYVGTLYKNTSGATVELSGGSGHKGPTIKDGEFAACTGDLWYKLIRNGSENTYYAADFEYDLVKAFVIGPNELTVGRTLSMDFAIQLAMLNANTNAQWVLEIRHGIAEQATTPSGVGPNYKDIAWNATPILSERLLVTDQPRTRTFGLKIKRSIVSGDDTLTTSVIKGGITSGATGPSAAEFVLNIRLTRFDVDDDTIDPKGYVGLVFPNPPNIAGTAATNMGTAIIAPS